MASIHKLLIFAVTIVLAVAIASASNANATSSLAERLKVEGETANCWESLFELQACSGEVITFFLNGETYLGQSCCKAIRVVGHDCWPDMLASLGFTSQEGDILQGYCDAEQPHSPPSPPSSPTTDLHDQVLP